MGPNHIDGRLGPAGTPQEMGPIWDPYLGPPEPAPGRPYWGDPVPGMGNLPRNRPIWGPGRAPNRGIWALFGAYFRPSQGPGPYGPWAI